MTEHTVTHDLSGGTRREVTRRIFAARGGRILGTQEDVLHVYKGSWIGWTFTAQAPVTVAFHTWAEAQDWMDEMFREREEWSVRRNGGTKLVII